MPAERRGSTRTGAPADAGTIALVSALPEIAAVIPPDDRPLADRILLMPQVFARDEDLAEVLQPVAGTAFDFVIVDGRVLKETTLAARSALELLGPGDVLAPPLTAGRQTESRAVSRYLAHGDVSLAVLDARFRQAARRWPGLSDVLHDRLGRQTHRASMHLAMLHLPRIEERVLALFSDLAERFGRVNPGGVVVDVPLTHEVIGRLVGGRRSSATLALQNLAAEGQLKSLDGGQWLLDLRAISP